MSIETQAHDGGPILPGTPLARALGEGAVPPLSPGFADRVIAAAEAPRPAPLPVSRRRSGRWSGWRTGQRLAVGAAGVVALASAAAATGLLQQLAIPVPSARIVWASIAGTAKAAPAAAPVPAAPPLVAEEPAAPEPVGIAGPIDTPEELGEAFRRVDAVREKRREMRRALVDQRIADEIARRRAAGRPEPTPEQLAQVRARIEEAQARRDEAVAAKVQERRAELEKRVAAGEPLTRRDMLRPLTPRPDQPPGSEALENLRRMAPRERREALRAMSPEERARIAEEYRARRAMAQPAPAPSASPSPAE